MEYQYLPAVKFCRLCLFTIPSRKEPNSCERSGCWVFLTKTPKGQFVHVKL
jgi:hypothetical protein